MKSDGSAEEKKSMDEKAMERSSVSQQQAGPESGRRLRGFALFSVLGALMLTLLLEALDQTVVGTALPRIIGSLQGFDRYTWAVTAYTLASVIMIPTVGKLSDQLRRKRFLIAGTVIFLAGSAPGWASPSPGAACRRFKSVAAIRAAAATICLLLGWTWGGDQAYDWNSAQVFGVLAASAVLYITSFRAERFAAEPVLPLALFRNRVFAAASLLSLLQLMVLVGLIIYLPLFLQGVLGESATYSGAVITPLTLSSVIGASVAGAPGAAFTH